MNLLPPSASGDRQRSARSATVIGVVVFAAAFALAMLQMSAERPVAAPVAGTSAAAAPSAPPVAAPAAPADDAALVREHDAELRAYAPHGG